MNNYVIYRKILTEPAAKCSSLKQILQLFKFFKFNSL